MINIHSHIFTDKDVPNGFLPAGLVRVLRTKLGYKVFKTVLHNIFPFSGKDRFDKMIHFVRAGKLGSQEKVFEELAKFYPEGSQFAILPMDMAYMGCGKVPRDYNEQLIELDNLSVKNPNVLPFLMLDPRNPSMTDLFTQYIMTWKWKGVKSYPALGYFPQDKRFDMIYGYCQHSYLPIMAHCTYGNPVHFKGSKKEFKQLLGDKYEKGLSKGELSNKFTNPDNWVEVARSFPNLKICLAHSGGSEQWVKWMEGDRSPENLFEKVKRACKVNDNIYMDVSYTLGDLRLLPMLKLLLLDPILKHKILFGSDYYMNLMENFSEGEWSINFRADLGEANFKLISETNNKKYLYG